MRRIWYYKGKTKVFIYITKFYIKTSFPSDHGFNLWYEHVRKTTYFRGYSISVYHISVYE
jgi:hypothetical protein